MVVRFADNVVRQYLDEAYKARVNEEALQQPFWDLSTVAVATLAGLTASLCDASFTRLRESKWGAVTSVGDHSAYVADMCSCLKRTFTVVKKRLDVTPFRAFCDKFVTVFVQRFQAAVNLISKCSESGAQQLLLDTQAIKAVLLQLPLCTPASDRALAAIAATGRLPAAEEEEGGGEGDKEAAAAAGGDAATYVTKTYTTYISKEINRTELYFKVLSASKDRFATTLRALWADAVRSPDLVRRLLSIKDVSVKDQEEVLRSLGIGPARPAPSTGGFTSMLGLGGGGGGV